MGGGGGVLELENPEGRKGSSSVGNLNGRRGKGEGVGIFSGITHCHSMSRFVGNFSLT